MGTNKAQSITITASSNLDEKDIDKAIKEAEAHAEEDKKRKELVQTKNDADNLVFALEKMLKDNGDSISAEDKDKLTKAIEEAKKEFETDDIEKLRAAMDKLSKENEAIVTKLYQNAAAKAQAEQNTESKKDDDEVIVEDPKDKENK